jgi:truncated hemoglobin YjbI
MFTPGATTPNAPSVAFVSPLRALKEIFTKNGSKQEDPSESSLDYGMISIELPSTEENRRIFKRTTSKQKLVTQETEAWMIMLNRALQERKLRQVLLNALLTQKSDSATKMRFCSVVEEFKNTANKRDRITKGRKIVSTFVVNGSMFQCSGVPKDMQNNQAWGKEFEGLLLLRNQFELELTSLPEVQKALKEMFSLFI